MTERQDAEFNQESEPQAEQFHQDAGQSTGRETAEEAQVDSQAIVDELNRVADSFSQAVHAAWASEQRKQLQEDLHQGLRRLVNGMEEVLSDFNRSDRGQDVRERTERVVQKVRTNSVAAELQQGLTQGLRAVADELNEFVERMERSETERTSAQSNVGDEPQDIPVQRASDSSPTDTPDQKL